MQTTLSDYFSAHQSRFIEELKDLCRIPSISALPSHRTDIHLCAEWLKQHLTAIGMQNAEVCPTPHHPMVYADWCHAPGQPTVLIYGHYDVQPVDPLELWQSPPFEPTIQGDYLVARGVSDDKGSFFCHFKSLEGFFATTGKLPINVKIFLEGEEESGSPSMAAFLEVNKEKLKADAVLVSDTAIFSRTQPSIGTSLRGLLYVELIVHGPESDQHSGTGGPVPNPINALCQIISRLKDENGQVTIPHFYDCVPEISEKRRANIRSLNFNDDDYKARLGVSELVGEPGFSTLEKQWYRPTLDCNGIMGGFTGDGAKTVITSRAMAKFSMRLVGQQNPDTIFQQLKDFLPRIAPPGVRCELISHSGGFPTDIHEDSPYIQAAMAAYRTSWGQPPVFQGFGGSIPVVNEFKQILGLDAVMMGFALPDDQIHAPNERFRLDHFEKGIRCSALFLENLVKS